MQVFSNVSELNRKGEPYELLNDSSFLGFPGLLPTTPSETISLRAIQRKLSNFSKENVEHEALHGVKPQRHYPAKQPQADVEILARLVEKLEKARLAEKSTQRTTRPQKSRTADIISSDSEEMKDADEESDVVQSNNHKQKSSKRITQQPHHKKSSSILPPKNTTTFAPRSNSGLSRNLKQPPPSSQSTTRATRVTKRKMGMEVSNDDKEDGILDEPNKKRKKKNGSGGNMTELRVIGKVKKKSKA